MARNPTRMKPQERARAAAQKMRDAFHAAKSRTGDAGLLVALSAGGLFLAFVLLAVLAPVVMGAPAFVANIVGFVLFALVIAATLTGAVALWRMIKAGGMEADSAQTHGSNIFSQTAVDVALSDAEDAGLRATGSRVVQEAMTGRLQGRPIAVMRADGVTYAVIRLKDKTEATLLMAPGHVAWPFAFPNDGSLTPIQAPGGVDALAWTTERGAGLKLSAQLAPAIAMSAAGGEIPFVSARGRALVLMWRRADVGTACVIAAEVAKAFP